MREKLLHMGGLSGIIAIDRLKKVRKYDWNTHGRNNIHGQAERRRGKLRQKAMKCAVKKHRLWGNVRRELMIDPATKIFAGQNVNVERIGNVERKAAYSRILDSIVKN